MEPVQISVPRLVGLVVGLMLLATSCQSDPSILEQALDPGTATPTAEPTPTALPSAMPSALQDHGTPSPVSEDGLSAAEPELEDRPDAYLGRPPEDPAPEDYSAVPPEVVIRELVRPGETREPPTIRVTGHGTSFELTIWTTCWIDFIGSDGTQSDYCADGVPDPVDELERVRGAGPLYVEFPVAGWEFSATATLAGKEEECGRSQTEPLARIAPTVHELVPQGFAGTYIVDVYGSGQGGDVVSSFVWETTVDGVLPVPKANMGLLWFDDGRVTTYAAGMSISGLAITPDSASARVIVTAANGASTEVRYVEDRPEGCRSPGLVGLDVNRGDALRAAALGEAPFTYDVELTMDDTVYRATATWPRDEFVDHPGYVPLRFEPALPALTPTEAASTEVSDPTEGLGGSVHYVPSVVTPMPGASKLEGQPFAPSGAMPAAIIASTVECDIVAVDSQTGDVTILSAYVSGDCSDEGIEYQEYTGSAEIALGFIEDVEWADPKYVLTGNCCEPAVGRFEVLDLEEHDQPYRLGLDGSYPSISDRGELLFSAGGFDVRSEFAALGIAPFEVSYNDSDPSYPSYQQVGDVSYHTLALDDGGEGTLNRTSFVYRTTWVADSVVAVGIFTARGESDWLPWVAVIGLDSGPVAANTRGVGWMHPTGEQLGNLVVAEQRCFGYLSQCTGSPSKVVVVDSETLDPLYEVEVDDTIVDMDLVRGWLLVTLVDGRMGTLDLSDGSFNVLANGIRNAVWQE